MTRSAGRTSSTVCSWEFYLFKTCMTRTVYFLLLLGCLLLGRQSGFAASRIRDLASIEGVRENQLVGYGVVVGLAGTGDKRQTVFSAQSLANTLVRMGVTVSPTAIQVRNTASVLVTANLPPFAQPGNRLDVTVAAIGDSTNLQGGLLILTPLRAANGQTYAVAQGSVVTGGFVAGRGGNSQTLNHPTAGRITEGGIIERAAPSVAPEDSVRLQLHHSDFATAARIAEAVNHHFEKSPHGARAVNSGLIEIGVPEQFKGRSVEFIAEVQGLTVTADRPSRIVINERTGTLVFGGDIVIAPVAILHGNLTVEVQTTFAVSQPNSFNNSGQTTVVPQVGIGVKEDKAKDVVLKNGATVEELVRALTAIGSTPRDIIAILQGVKAAGALDAEVEIL